MNERIKIKIDPTIHSAPMSDAEALWCKKGMTDKQREVQRRWKSDVETQTVHRFPLHIQYEPTTKCNLSCKMCPRTNIISAGKEFPILDGDLELYMKIIDEGAEKGLGSIKYGHLGEPTMSPHIMEMVKYAHDRNIETVLSTNGTLLTEKLARQLIDAGLDKLFFSFDSPHREHYNAIRVNADYDKVLLNIRRFHQIRKDLGMLTPLTRASMVMTKENENEWKAFQELFVGLADRVEWVDFTHHDSMDRMDDKIIINKNKQNNKFCCPQLWQRIMLFADGDVTICCLDSAKVFKMGNVKNQTVEEIWTSKKYQDIRTKHATGRIVEIPVCSNCDMTYTLCES